MKGIVVTGLFTLRRHSRLRTLLSSYIDGEVSPGEARRLEEHLATCAQCRSELETLTMSVELIRELPELELPHSFVLDSPPAREPRLRLGVWAPRLATSAVGVLLVALLAGDATGALTQSGQADTAVSRATAEEAAVADSQALPPVAAAAPAPAMAAAAAPAEAEPIAEAAPKAAMRAPVAAAPAPAPAATPAPAPLQSDEESVAEAPRVIAQREAAGTPELTTGAAVVEAESVDDADDEDGVDLPLRELQIAAGAAFAALLVAMVWLARRRGPWSV